MACRLIGILKLEARAQSATARDEDLLHRKNRKSKKGDNQINLIKGYKTMAVFTSLSFSRIYEK